MKRKSRRKSFQGGGVTPSPGCHQVFPLLTACLAACQHFSTHTKQIQFHIELKNNTKATSSASASTISNYPKFMPLLSPNSKSRHSNRFFYASPFNFFYHIWNDGQEIGSLIKRHTHQKRWEYLLKWTA